MQTEQISATKSVLIKQGTELPRCLAYLREIAQIALSITINMQ